MKYVVVYDIDSQSMEVLKEAEAISGQYLTYESTENL